VIARLLLLGGTADARRLAESLTALGIEVIYSIAGLVRTPEVACEIFSGGFSQVGGLIPFIRERKVGAILDATHPYARIMSETALAGAKECGIPYWRFQRPAWQAQEGDRWQSYSNWNQLLEAIRSKKSVFLTVGQPDQDILAILADYQTSGQQQLLRTAVSPRFRLPGRMQWVKAIGPFDLESERALMYCHGIDALVSKNSGGDSTVAKLVAARELGIPVYMLERPELKSIENEFNDITAAQNFVARQFNRSGSAKHLTVQNNVEV